MLALHFLPNILYLGIKAHLFKLADVKKTLEVNLIVDESWFPISSNQPLIGRLLFGASKTPEIIFIKNNWLKPWKPKFIIISKLATASSSKFDCETAKHVAFSKYMPENESTSSRLDAHNVYVYTVPKINLSFTTKDLSSFNAIKYIACEG